RQRHAFAHLAIVHLKSEGVTLPIEVVEGRTVVCRIKLKGGSEAITALEYRRDAWLRRIYDNLRLASERARELNKKLAQSLQAARDEADDGLKNLEGEVTHLTQEQGELKRLAQENKLTAK